MTPDPDPGDVTPQQQVSGTPRRAPADLRVPGRDRPLTLEPWPDIPAIDITGPLANWELSGVAIGADGTIWVVDDGGRIGQRPPMENWRLVASGLGDLEGIAIAPAGVYVVEERRSVVGLVTSSGQVLQTWDLRPYVEVGDNWGLEGIAVLPDGRIAVGSQMTGKVYTFRLDGQDVTPGPVLGPFHDGSRFITRDLSDLTTHSGYLWALYDADNRLIQATNQGQSVRAWALPSGSRDQEGVAFTFSGDLVMAQDNGRLYQWRGWYGVR